MMSKRICVFVDRLDGGGAERVLLSIANALASRHTVDLVLACNGGILSELISPDVNVVHLSARRTLESLPGLIRYMRRCRPDALLTGKVNANGVAAIAGRIARAGTRIVISEHSLVRTSQRASLIKGVTEPSIIRLLYPLADRLIAVSPAAADEVCTTSKLPLQATRIIPNPVIGSDFERMSLVKIDHPFFSSGNPVVVAMGRLEPIKGFDDIIRAMPLLKTHLSARLIIIGEGSDRNRLEHLIRQHDLEDRVSLPGFYKNPLPFLRAANLFCMSSHAESLGNVMIEALAVGTPVLARDAPGGSRHIFSGKAKGSLLEDFSPDSLAESIDLFLSTAPSPDLVDLTPYRAEDVIASYEAVLLE